MTPNRSKIWPYQPPHGACSKGIPAEPPPASSFERSSASLTRESCCRAARSIFAATHIFLVQPSLGLGRDAADLRAQIAQIVAGAHAEAHPDAATPPRPHESAYEGGTPPEGDHHE